MINLLKKIFGGGTLLDVKSDFEPQYTAIRFISAYYLSLGLEQIFQSEPYKTTFADEPEVHITLAAQINNYLFGDDLDPKNYSKLEKESFDRILQVLPHVSKWADDVMTSDKELCELVVQTLRMETLLETETLSNSAKGKRVSEILKSYGSLVKESPNPKSYTALVNRWISWARKNRSQK